MRPPTEDETRWADAATKALLRAALDEARRVRPEDADILAIALLETAYALAVAGFFHGALDGGESAIATAQRQIAGKIRGFLTDMPQPLTHGVTVQ